jgi:hypothetical protein
MCFNYVLGQRTCPGQVKRRPAVFARRARFSVLVVQTLFSCVLAVFQCSKHVKVKLSDGQPFCARYLKISFFFLLMEENL